MDPLLFTLVMAGGAAGAVMRYFVNAASDKLIPGEFPAGTLVINISGSFAAGFVATAASAWGLPEMYTFGILTGFLGSYTTFSTWMVQTTALMKDGFWIQAASNLLISAFGGVTAALAGIGIARIMF